MEALGKVSTRLTWRHKAFFKTKLLSQHTYFFRDYKYLPHSAYIPQRCTQVQNRIVQSQVCQNNACLSFLKVSCWKMLTDGSHGVTWTLCRSFSGHSDGYDSEDLHETQKEFSKSKTQSVESSGEGSQIANKAAEVLTSVANDDTYCDKLDNGVLKGDEGFRLDRKNTIIKSSLQSTSENDMEYVLNKVNVTRTNDIAADTEEGAEHRAAVYGDDSESSESDEDDSDLFSDTDSDGSSSDVDNSYSGETAGSKDHISGSNSSINDLELLHKEGFTTEEMITHIEQSQEITEDLNNDEWDEMDEELCDINIVTGEHKSSSDLSPISSQSRHFNEDGVISFVDLEKEKSKSREWSVKEIEDFVNISSEHVEELPWQPPVSLERGKQGVFDIEDLVLLVRNENLLDIVTLRIPPEKHFGDYMVIGTAKSLRHMRAVCETVNWIYKQRKSTGEKFLKQEGKQDDSGWIALDLGNIILHIFLKEERELYDLETLWSVGSSYDDQCQEQEDPYALSLEDHPWLKELEDLKNRNMIIAGYKK